ncbi:alpha/beta fold hydrolase [Pacificoceanicola onchidii]|uniref:alpha/beta fold hydrolase n=1 Tax=Pacificoceanicola onchidii TaxID=2562685 RepID=UPI0010A6AA02|nr:alpha/beta hydrolase [Pacificoceanicola onchidii]
MSKDTNFIRLSDGTQMCFAEYGSSKGEPVVMLHGNPGSRLSWGDLPGSPFRDDIRIIAPYALACAWKAPERFGEILLFGAVGPNHPKAVKGALKSLRTLWRLAGPLYPVVRLQMRIFAWLTQHSPERLMKLIRDAELTEADRKIFDRPDLQALFAREFPEAYRQGGIGSAYDTTLPGCWPIPLHQIKSHIHIWHAAKDQLVGNMPIYLHEALPNSSLTLIPDAGHLWVLDNDATMLGAVMAPSRNDLPFEYAQ